MSEHQELETLFHSIHLPAMVLILNEKDTFVNVLDASPHKKVFDRTRWLNTILAKLNKPVGQLFSSSTRPLTTLAEDILTSAVQILYECYYKEFLWRPRTVIFMGPNAHPLIPSSSVLQTYRGITSPIEVAAVRCPGIIHLINLSTPDATLPIKWCNRIWYPKTGNSKGPGPNNWSANNVNVDANGDLHLKLSTDPTTGMWYCAELVSDESFQFGEFEFQVIAPLDKLDANIVLGMFLYGSDLPDGTHEIDIEFSAWGKLNTAPNGVYVVYPTVSTSAAISHDFSLPLQGTYSTHRLAWNPDRVLFQSFHGHGSNTALASWCCDSSTQQSISQHPMSVRINLWLFRGHAPSNEKPIEVVMRKFTHTPIAALSGIPPEPQRDKSKGSVLLLPSPTPPYVDLPQHSTSDRSVPLPLDLPLRHFPKPVEAWLLTNPGKEAQQVQAVRVDQIQEAEQVLDQNGLVLVQLRLVGDELWMMGSATDMNRAQKILLEAAATTTISQAKHIPQQSSSAIQPHHLLIPMTELTLETRLGAGSYGEVFLGRFRGTRVAVKRLLMEGFDEDHKKEFLDEVQVMMRLQNPRITQLMAYTDPNESRPCLVMQLMEGGSLYDALYKYKKPVDAVRVACDIAEGLAFLHSHKPPIVHRDIKSMNVLLDRHGDAKIADFGLTKIKATTASAMQTTVGSPAWMAPEIIARNPYGVKADVYSFGIVLYELCVRELPWKGEGPMQIMFAVAKGERPVLPASVPAKWQSVIKQCWADDPTQRSNMLELLPNLELLPPILNLNSKQ